MRAGGAATAAAGEGAIVILPMNITMNDLVLLYSVPRTIRVARNFLKRTDSRTTDRAGFRILGRFEATEMFDSIEDVLDLIILRIPAQEFYYYNIFYFTPAAQVSSLSANS